MQTARATRTKQPASKVTRPTYEVRPDAWKLLADQSPHMLYRGRVPKPNLTAIAECAGLSPTTLMKVKKKEQPLTFEIFNCLTNFLVTCGWDRIEAQEALFLPLGFAAPRRLRAA